jgi:hypothetical protein
LQNSVNNPYLFVIRVWYYKAGESYATEMHDTFINFTGYEGTTAAGLSGNVLGEVQPQLEDGVWKTFSFDLLEALSIMDPSTAYYITEIDFINQLDGTTTNLQDRVMEFAWIQMRDGSALVSETLDSSGKMQLDILNSMIGASTDTYQNYIVNTIYARERRHDKLNVYVKGTVNNDFDIIQGVNLFNLQNQKYTPKDDLINCETIVYPVDNAGDYGLSQQINPTSANRYAILDNYQTNTDVESMYYESEQTAELLKEQADVEWSYDAIVTGAPNLQIGGLINAYLDENFLAGEQLVTMGKYVFDRTVTSTPLLTVAVSLQKPSHQFLAKLKDKQLRRLLNPAGTASNIYRAVDPAYSDYIYSGYSIQTAPAASAPGKPGTTSGNASGPNLKLFTDVTGTTLTNAQSLYTWMHDNFTWEDYNSDEKSNPQLVNEWKASHHVRANCTDMSQFCYILLKELGYTVHYKHGDIVCGSGVWGHVWLSIQGNEYSKATIFDPTACTQPDVNKPLGHLTCEEGAPYNVSTDDAWLLARDTTLSN